MQGFTLHTTPHIVFEPGGVHRLGEIAGPRLGARVLLITDPGLRKAGHADAAVDALNKAGCSVEVYGEVEEDPSRATVEAAMELLRKVLRFIDSMICPFLCSNLLSGRQALSRAPGVDFSGQLHKPRRRMVQERLVSFAVEALLAEVVLVERRAVFHAAAPADRQMTAD